MHWPPQIGAPLPRAGEAIGVREKLAGYSLDPNHWKGGPKARGFELILGITLNEIEHLASAIEAGVLDIAVSDVRDNSPYGFTCEVLVPVGGLGARSSRVIVVTTAWELTDARAFPRLVNAYIRD